MYRLIAERQLVWIQIIDLTGSGLEVNGLVQRAIAETNGTTRHVLSHTNI